MTNLFAPRAEFAAPLRRRWAMKTGAVSFREAVAWMAYLRVAGALLQVPVDLDDRVIDIDDDEVLPGRAPSRCVFRARLTRCQIVPDGTSILATWCGKVVDSDRHPGVEKPSHHSPS